MKRQSAEEYTKERVRTLETPEERIKRLATEATETAGANDIPFLAITSEGASLSGKGSDLLKLAALAAAEIAVEIGAPVEELEKNMMALIRPAYEVVKHE